ncbi:MAG: Ger(x)C family spore germination protein [Clostridiaceae bacterium]|nr:Ger(x)C family spore germination protein [Clostridiaceae bacterium]
MNSLKKLLTLLYVILFIMLCTACWDYREVDRLTIVAGIAIDKAYDDDLLLTFEVADLLGAKSDKPIKSVIMESRGETFMSAIRNILSKDNPRLYFGHTTVAILSRDIAEEGAMKVVDFLLRDGEPRLNINLFVSEEETASELFKYKPSLTELFSVELTNIMDEQKNLAKAIPVPAYKFVNAVSGEGISAVLPSLCIVDNAEGKTVKVCGTAIFKEDRLQGFISGEDTFTLSFILDEVKGGVIVAKKDSETGEKKVTLEILDSKTEIKPVYSDNKISIEINIDVKAFLNENMGGIELKGEDRRAELKKCAEEQMNVRIKELIKKVQEGYGADIFGFGNSVYKNMPKVWKEKKDEWGNIFRDLEVTVNTNIEIKHLGLLLEPIKIGD